MAGPDRVDRQGQVCRPDRRLRGSAGRYHRTSTRQICDEGRQDYPERDREMTFSKDTALQLCTLNEAAYTLATTGHCDLPAGFTPPVPIRMGAGDRPFF